MTTLNTVIAYGLYASMPAAGIPGRLYFTMDTGQIYRDNGTSWLNVSPTGVAPVQLSVTTGAPGNFAVTHGLGVIPAYAVILMTSGGAIWFQSPTMWDVANVYLSASDAGLTAVILVYA